MGPFVVLGVERLERSRAEAVGRHLGGAEDGEQVVVIDVENAQQQMGRREIAGWGVHSVGEREPESFLEVGGEGKVAGRRTELAAPDPIERTAPERVIGGPPDRLDVDTDAGERLRVQAVGHTRVDGNVVPELLYSLAAQAGRDHGCLRRACEAGEHVHDLDRVVAAFASNLAGEHDHLPRIVGESFEHGFLLVFGV